MEAKTQTRSPRVLHLVLYSPEKSVYKEMMEFTRRWYATFESRGVTTLYYLRDEAVATPTIDARNPMLLRLPGKESYAGILAKTLQALQHFFPAAGQSAAAAAAPFDFVVRSNVSTVVNFAHLLELLAQQRDSLFYGGTHIMTVNSVACSAEADRRLAPLSFAHGTCMVLRKDAVRFLLDNAAKLSHEIEDDASIGLLFKKVRLATAHARFDPRWVGTQYAFFSSDYPIDTATAFRNHHFESDRQEDVTNLRRAVRALFQRYVHLAVPREVRAVYYYNVDVTERVRELCAGAGQYGKWSTTQDNGALDALFGDPCPNQVKTLLLHFADDDAAPFAQRAALTFALDAGTGALTVN